MGMFIYGPSMLSIEIDDVVLAHLQILLSSKLRRQESFMLSWTDSTAVGGGRSAVWVDSSLQMMFRYTDPERPTIDRAWLDELSIAAMSPAGLDLSDPGCTSHPAKAQANSVKCRSSA